MKRMTIVLSGLILTLFVTSSPAGRQIKNADLSITSMANLPINIMCAGDISCDKNYVYIGSYQGQVYVLDKSKKGYPVATILQQACSISCVKSDGNAIYTTTYDGYVCSFAARKPFTRLSGRKCALGLFDLAVGDTTIQVSTVQSSMAMDGPITYFSQLNEGDEVLVLDKKTLSPLAAFSPSFQPDTTQIFGPTTQIGGVPNPPDLFGQGYQAVNLFASDGLLIQTIPGPLGSGAYMYQNGSFIGVIPDFYANVAVKMQCGLIAIGTEAGTVDLFDVTDPGNPKLIVRADLRALTGQSAIDAVEVRCLIEDPFEPGTLYAGTSHSDPTAPSFLALRLN
jgi:hypothetical protein